METLPIPKTLTPRCCHPAPKRPLLILSALLFLSVAAYGGYWYGKQQVVPSPTTTPKATEPKAQPAIDETVGWEAYTSSNPVWKYTFKYPKEWIVVEPPNQDDKTVTIRAPSDQWLTVILDLKALGLPCEKVLSEEQVTVGGLSATKTVTEGITDGDLCENGGSGTTWVTVTVRGVKHLISMSYPMESSLEAQKTFSQILSTFRFLDQRAEEKMGFVKQTYGKDGGKYLVVDPVRWSTNEELERTPNTWTMSTGGEVTLPVSSKVEVLIMGGRDASSPTLASFSDFEEMVQRWDGGVLSTLTIESGQVTKIGQEYLP